MRRFLLITGIFLPVFFLSACDSAVQLNDSSPVLEFKGDVDIKSDEMQMKASIIRDKNGVTQINITSPETLKGLNFKHSETENSISKDELSYKTDELVIPSSSSIASIMEALDCMSTMKDEKPFYKDEKEMAFIGKIDNGKFELRADRKTGLITEIKIGEKITALFSKQDSI